MEVGFFIFGLTGLLTLICFIPPLARQLKLPYSVLLAIVGCLLGFFIQTQTNLPGFIEDFMITIKAFDISSDTFLMVFLPILLFETALNMNIRRLMDDWAPILLMAIVAVVICTIFVGVSLDYLSDYGLIACLLLGAIIATTDPVSVVGIFREVGAPKRLSNLVEGESLFNDAASIALYAVLLTVLTSNAELSALAVIHSFLFSFLGGIFAGYVFGWLTCLLFRYLRGYPHAEITLTITLAYLSFFISDHYLEVSGVVATVVAGLVIGTTGRTRMSPTTFESLETTWSQFGFWANSLIFMFAAMLIPGLMAKATMNEIWLTVILFVVAHIARAITVFGLLPLLTLTRFGNQVSHAYKTVMLWGGLRGAVSLALALAITEHKNISYDVRHFIGVATTGFVLLTLLVNGTTMRKLMQYLKLNQLTKIEQAVRNQVQQLALEEVQQKVLQVADSEKIHRAAKTQIDEIFHAVLANLKTKEIESFTLDMRVTIGLVVSAQQETDIVFNALKAEMIDWRTAEHLMSQAETNEDRLRNQGLKGFRQKLSDELAYTHTFNISLKIYFLTGITFWLGKELEQRFIFLLSKRLIILRLMEYIQQQIRPLLHEEATDRILTKQKIRLAGIDTALEAMQMQYPQYALWLQKNYLGKVARLLEYRKYNEIRSQQLINDEVYADLMYLYHQRWKHLKEKPALDAAIEGMEMVQKLPYFQHLSVEQQTVLVNCLETKILTSGQHARFHTNHKRCIGIVFISTGAVQIATHEHHHKHLHKIGTGEHIVMIQPDFVEHIALKEPHSTECQITALSYTKLLILWIENADSFQYDSEVL